MKQHKSKISSAPEFEQLKSVLIELGAKLQETRQEQGLSLDYISTKTHIRQSLLRAIEEGRLEQLPEPVYVHYFLREYANLLGLDGSTFARPFPSESRFQFLSAARFSLPVLQLRPIHLYLLYIAIIFGSVNGLSSFIERSIGSSAGYLVENAQPTSERVATATAASPVIASEPPSPSIPSQPLEVADPATSPRRPEPQPPTIATITPTQNASSEPVRVNVSVSEAAWVRVEADGETTFEGTLTKGTKQTWVANQKLIILTGNAGGVSVALNEGEAEQLGENGAVEEVIFTASRL
ncbi:helix-turn-helix domain-containing protein [Roseofilum casamattae]|uniref:DUF4115 domain-containing protein n=1 Tax=Roseofilum casamattae BLCC-M143 TaxID=3022442 RepID=A0ABT7BYC8_9CYAN|nr:RodZ domain-containing protein [Roseofilum casamattae]MDJ1183514.1 DUF4115 domain-containing protein [Roseofilum casamattae BLCC-M143]